MTCVAVRRKLRRVERRFRESRLFARAMVSPRHPILAHLIPARRCNLACGFCNEYDGHSPVLPAEELLRRIDLLAALGTSIVTLSGGEPLLHPELETLIRRIRLRGIVATVITNGYLLTPGRITSLNRAGLDFLQVSIDNVTPDEVSQKSLTVLDQKLQWLAKGAEFGVVVNSVLGSAIKRPGDVLLIARRTRELGFTCTVGILHEDGGQLGRPLAEQHQQVYEDVLRLGTPVFSFAHYHRFQKNIMRRQPNDWHCPAGSRYLYVCEDGLVHWCSQRRGRPGTPLEKYTKEDLDREYDHVKACAPYCTISCVHQTAVLDHFRVNPREALEQFLAMRRELDPAMRTPVLIRLLSWLFLQGSRRRLLERIALRLLGVRR